MGQGWAQPLGEGVWPNPASLHVEVCILGQDGGYLGFKVGYLGSEGGKGWSRAAHRCAFISSEMWEPPGRPLPKRVSTHPLQSQGRSQAESQDFFAAAPQLLSGKFGN